MLKIAAILAFTQFFALLRGGFPQRFQGAALAAPFFGAVQPGGQPGAQDDYFSYIKIKRCQCRAIEAADDRYRS
jgi:hypothetical protein